MKKVHLLLIYSFLQLGLCHAQESGYILDFISTKQGLSHNYVSSIVSDDLNMKWIGTENGITRYNGFDFEYIKPGEAYRGLLNENIEVLFMDGDHNLWIGTKSGGLSFLGIQSNQTKNFNHLIDQNNKGDIRVTALSQDKDGNIWIGTWSDGLFVIDPKKDVLLRHYHSNSQIYCIERDFRDNMWFRTDRKLNLFHAENGLLKVFPSRLQVTDFLSDPKRNKVWIALVGKEPFLYSYDYQKGSIDSIFTGVRSNFSRKLSLDHYDRIWIGTWGQGVYRSKLDLSSFDKIELNPEPYQPKSRNFDIILDIHHDQNNLTWLATANGGLIKLLEGNGFQNADRLLPSASIRHSLNCSAIYKDRDNLWVGTFNGLYQGKGFETLAPYEGVGKAKINAFFKHKGKLYIGSARGFYVVEIATGLRLFRSGSWIQKATSFIVDGDRLYIGTQQQGLAIVNLNKIHEEAAYEWYSESLSGQYKIESNRITSIKKDEEGRIWVSTYNGLHLFEQEKKRFVHQSHFLDKNLPSVIVNSMLIKDGVIWLASPNGLIKLKFQDEKLHIKDIISKEDGLNSDFICSITTDQKANLWLSTHTEIVKFNEKDQSIISYGQVNGVKTTSFNNKSFYNYNNEMILFGGVDNITFFNPSDLKDFSSLPEVMFTKLRVNNELIRFEDGNSILEKEFPFVDKITLNHKQDFFSTAFVANDFLGNLNIKYRYLLEDYQDQWIGLQNRNEINFTGLPPGKYTLKVQASRDNQNWSQEKPLDIVLLGSPWLSSIALIIYALIIALIALYLIKSNNDRLKLKNSLEIARIDKEKEAELAEAKLSFFTNISHEFRTPLTLITAPLNELLGIEELPSKAQKHLRYIDRNTHRLLDLTNQLLDFRKAEQGLLELNLFTENFIPFARQVFGDFEEAAKAKRIKFHFETEQEVLLLSFDRKKMAIVLYNLLSNALKYTAEEGEIRMTVKKEGEACVLSVKDTGIGMRSVDAGRIFDRFFQVKSSNTASLVGSGIGLAFSKEIIALHDGDIQVESKLNVGTEFTLTLPLDEKEGKTNSVEEAIQKEKTGFTERNYETVVDKGNSQATKKEHSILIIDDNPEILAFLNEILSESYRILQAEDGVEGFEIASSEIPDLIISDVMMPRKDGVMLCHEIKSQLSTSHIPVVLLTAKSATVHEIEGLEMGADDYIAKPFNVQVVKARIRNIFESREKMRAYLQNKVRFEPSVSSLEVSPNREDIFIDKAIALVESNLDNPDFGIESMVDQLHMSQSTLYRKIKSLTGLSLTAFIRSIRLKKSAQLILSTDLNLNQIAYEVGFNDYKYFKNSFKKQFDCAPSHYRELKKL